MKVSSTVHRNLICVLFQHFWQRHNRQVALQTTVASAVYRLLHGNSSAFEILPVQKKQLRREVMADGYARTRLDVCVSV